MKHSRLFVLCVVLIGTTLFGVNRAQTETLNLDFDVYPTPDTYGEAGETAISHNLATGATIFHMKETITRVRWDESSPPKATWEDVSWPTKSPKIRAWDPHVWVDQDTGRTWIAHNNYPAIGSTTIAFTDNDATSWKVGVPVVTAPSFDHGALATGPFVGARPSSILGSTYPNALYYCIFTPPPEAQCSRSDDGGDTWGAPLPLPTCRESNNRIGSAMPGKIAVGPDGTLYVPMGSCLHQQSVAISRDMGQTWELSRIPGTTRVTPELVTPSVVLDQAGTVYFVGMDERRPVVVISEDKGRSWQTPIILGGDLGVQSATFPMAVAGADGRLGVAFYGTTDPGDIQAPDWPGTFHLYAGVTVDKGATWEVVNVTPDDPVQRGTICLITTCDRVNLLHYQQMTVDADGRMIIGYADGCVTPRCKGPQGTVGDSNASVGVIARQSSGPPLFGTLTTNPTTTTTVDGTTTTTTTTKGNGKDKCPTT